MRSHQQTMRDQRGFTLAEILVTTAIFAIIMIAALTVYDQSNRVFKTSTEAADLQQSTRIGFDKLVSDLRMAGFDYSRGGIPTGDGQFPQPDEQIEYAGSSAVVFRANFNYNSAASSGNGLAPNYSASNAGGGLIFPYVSTDNTEIVAYALRSTAPGAANADSISFYVDSAVPRRAYPNVAGLTSGGQPENRVTLTGIDLSNNNPPYTLYRVTVDDILNNRTGTPVAENIRSVQFKYYTDGAGTQLLTNNDGTAITTGRNAGGGTFTATGSGAIGGDGQYDPANQGTTSNFADRIQRAMVQSVRVDLVGMNANVEANFQNPTETNAAFAQYRQFALSSLIVPRNLGKTGFPEPSYTPPGPPTITGMCIGHCGAPILFWSPPTGGGPVVSYRVEWDTNPNGTFNSGFPIGDPSVRSAIIPDDGALDVAQIVYYHVLAVNDNGTSQPSALYPASPKNTTKPAAPAALTTTNNQLNQVTLSWTAPSTNASGSTSCSGTGGTSSLPPIPFPQEIIKYRVARGTTANFNPDAGEGIQVLSYTSASQPAPVSGGATVTWVDNSASSNSPPAGCVPYYYRVRALDRCYKQANWNVSGNTTDSMSDWFPALGANAISGAATSTSTPSQIPGTPLIDRANTSCVSNASCRITMQWQKIATDTNNAAIAVDAYQIIRERRPQGSGNFVRDATFGGLGLGTLDVAGYSQVATPSYSDTTAVFSDPVTGPWEYRYTIAGKVCSNYGVYSNPVLYPGCALGVTISQIGASSGNGTSPASPWVMAYGDTITPTAGAGVTISRVDYNIYAYPAGTLVSTIPVTTSPFAMSWSDLTDMQTYQVWITITDSNNCSETHIEYVQQEQQAACAFTNQIPPIVSVPSTVSTYSIAGRPSSSETGNYNFIVPNTSTQPMNVYQPTPTPSFTGTMSITWRDPCNTTTPAAVCGGKTFPDLFLKSAEWDVASSGCASVLTATSGTGAIGSTVNATKTTNYDLPSQSICNVPATPGKMTLKVVFQYDGRSKPTLPATPSAPLKICITYRNPLDATRTQFCNLVGQAASTNNPRSCD